MQWGPNQFFARLFFCSFVAVPTLDSYFITASGGSGASARMEVVRSICSLSFYARVCT